MWVPVFKAVTLPKSNIRKCSALLKNSTKVCAQCTVPSHFSRICTVSPISSGRPCWTVPRKLASTKNKKRHRTPTWVFLKCLSSVMQLENSPKTSVGWRKTKSSSGKGRGGSINNLCRWNKSYKTSLYFGLFFCTNSKKEKKVTHKPKLHKYILSNTEYTKDGSQRYFCINATPPHQIIFHESSMFLSHPGLFTVVIHCPLRD